MSKRRNIYDEISEDYAQALEYRVASDSWKFNGDAMTPSNLCAVLSDLLGASNQPVANAMQRYAYEQYRIQRDGMVKWLGEIEMRPQSDKALRDWLIETQNAGATEMEHEAHVHAMKQWIWQVKRGIAGQEVRWHVAPIMWCKMNGTGKTYNLRKLVDPIYQFVRELKVEELNEKFSGKMLARTLIVLLDEFEGCAPSEVPIIKSILTGKPFDKRGMMSESGFFAENRISCIGTSNKEPPHGFYDETGARRFWSIHTREEKVLPGTGRHRFYSGFDVASFWSAVRVSDEAPSASMSKELADYMDDVRNRKLRSKSSLESFLSDACEYAGSGDTSSDVKMATIIAAYRIYCSRTGLTPMRLNHDKMHTKLQEHGVKIINTHNKPVARGIRILEEYWPEK